jgi:DNA primase
MSEIEEVKARLDIVDVIGQSVHLTKAGRAFKAPCPFHAEKTPSFIVNPDRQTWHCFGSCATGGDVISFVMKREGIEFGEALRMLAERAGVKLKERRVSEEQDRARQRLYDANDAAAAYFQRQLMTDAGVAALEYVERRKVDESTARSFGLGYSLAGWQGLLDHLRGLRFGDREIALAGLATQGDGGSLHDRFRNRLMFPIWDAKGRTIGFGARALDADAVPKYLNTAQTPLFDKSGTLYALNKAGESIKREGRAVIVEGYMDVIAAHQHGFTNVVAQMGTALTDRQYKLVKKLADKIVLVLDADAAGQDAMERVARENSATEPVKGNVRAFMEHAPPEQQADAGLLVAALPFGKDPDDLIRADTTAWPELIESAKPYIDFWLDHIARRSDLVTPQGRTAAADEMLQLVGVIREPIIRAHYLQKVSRLVLLDEDSLNERSPRARPGRTTQAPAVDRRPMAARTVKSDTREGFLLALLVQYPQLREDGLKVPEELLWDTEARQVYEIWRNYDENAIKSALPTELLEYFERLILWKLPLSTEKEASEALQDCVQKLNQRRLQAEKQATAAQIADLQEQMGVSSFSHEPAGAILASAEGDATDSEGDSELQELLQRDMEIGRELHRRDRKDGRLTVEDGAEVTPEGERSTEDGRQAVEMTADG